MKKASLFLFPLFLFLVLVPVASAKNKHSQTPPAPPAPPIVTSTSTPGISWGAYAGASAATADTEAGFAALESSVGAKANTEAIFWAIGDSFPTGYSAGVNGQDLLIFWEPTASNFTYTSITNGSEDSYLASFAQAAKAYGYPVILVPFDEMNLGDAADCAWAPWGVGCNGNTAAQFIAAWQHIHGIFAAAGATNVEFGLDYNNASEPSNSTANFASFYPGDAYVDIVGQSCFNFGGETFAQACAPAFAQFKTFTQKPEWLFSTGSVSPQTSFMQAVGASGYPFVWYDGGDFQLQDLTTFKSIV